MKVKNFGTSQASIHVGGQRYDFSPNQVIEFDDLLEDDIKADIANVTQLKVISDNEQEGQAIDNIKFGTDDPTQVITDATTGQLYLRQAAPFGVYQKMDDGPSTNWELIAGGPMDTFSAAGFTFNIKDALFLFGKASSVTAQGFILNGPGTFQVPAGKKLIIEAARFGGNSGWQFGYCDNDPGLNGVDPGTLINLVYQGGGLANLAAAADGAVPVGFEVPAGKYPIEISGDGGLTYANYYCRLVDA